MTDTPTKFESFDAIDGEILHILAEDPRMPYSKITEHLENAGYEMSTEGVRYRVNQILDTTTVFFLLDPQQVTWEIVRVCVSSSSTEGAKQETFDFLCELPFWHVSRGLGTYDVYAVGSMRSIDAIDEVVTALRERDHIDDVDYLIVTDRNRDMHSYLNINYIETGDDV